jgi:hypothetical protein
MRINRLGLAVAGAVVFAACVGEIGGVPGDEAPDGPTQEVLNEIGVSGLRRLTAAEYDATVQDLLGVAVDSEAALPEDLRSPYDNDFTLQIASEALITSADSLAGQIAEQVVADTSLREAIMPCTPSGPDDAECYRAFVEAFGRRALRRPLVEEEVDGFMQFASHAVTADDFWIAIDSGLRAFLQHPHFLYRVEIGTPVEGESDVFRLTDFELATRASYLLIGSTPPDWLLDDAENGVLAERAGVEAMVEKLIDDDKMLDRVARFHGMWMSYERLPHAPDLTAAMQQETRALLKRVIFDEQLPWIEMLRSSETYLTADLATHYGLPTPDGGEGWVDYGDSGRQGLLSQGSFLSAVAKFGDTSPVQRGLLIRTRLFCQTINTPPPDLNVNIDEPPEGPDPNACKNERYNMWQTDGCKACHAQLEPVGFGLENYDAAGRYRDTEPDLPDCTIDGAGKLDGVGDFTGPAELADLMIEAGKVDECVSTQLLRFAMGRYALADEDENFAKRLTADASTETTGLEMRKLFVGLVTSEAFRHRREEVVQ